MESIQRQRWREGTTRLRLGLDRLIPPADDRLVARVIRIVTDPVTRLVIEDYHLTGIELDSGQIVPRTAVFLRIRGR